MMLFLTAGVVVIMALVGLLIFSEINESNY